MKIKRNILTFAAEISALLLIFFGCNLETDGKFISYVAGYGNISNILRPPSNVIVTDDLSGGINITWDGSEEADGYTVYRSSSADTSRFVRRGSSINMSYTDSGASVPPDTPFYYQITAYNKSGVSSPSETRGPVSAARNTAILTEPEITNAIVSSDNITVTWTSVTGAEGYILYRASLYDGDVYSFRIPTGDITYTDSYMASGSYFYQVRAFNAMGDGYVSLPWGPVEVSSGAALPAPNRPQNLKAAASYPSQSPVVTITWNSVSIADIYHIYRSTDDEYYEKTGESTSAAYTDNSVQNGEAYYYRVRGYNVTQEGYLSDSFGPVLLLPAIPQITLAVSGNNVTISWSAVKGADIYYVYRSADNTDFQLLTAKGIGDLSYADSALSYGAYYYRVEAANSAGIGFPSESKQVILTANAAAPVIGTQPVNGGPYIRNVPATALTVQASVNDGGSLSYPMFFVKQILVFITLFCLTAPSPVTHKILFRIYL